MLIMIALMMMMTTMMIMIMIVIYSAWQASKGERKGKGERAKALEDRTQEDRGRGRLHGRYFSFIPLSNSTAECLAVKIIQSKSHGFFLDSVCRLQRVLVYLVSYCFAQEYELI